MVYETIARNPGLRIPNISEVSGLKESQIHNELKELRKKNMIKYAGSNKCGGFHIS